MNMKCTTLLHIDVVLYRYCINSCYCSLYNSVDKSADLNGELKKKSYREELFALRVRPFCQLADVLLTNGEHLETSSLQICFVRIYI